MTLAYFYWIYYDKLLDDIDCTEILNYDWVKWHPLLMFNLVEIIRCDPNYDWFFYMKEQWIWLDYHNLKS